MSWGTVATTNGLAGGRIAAISKMPNLPFGGASTHSFSTQQLIWGFVKPDEVNVRLLDLTTLSMNTDEIYVPIGLRDGEVDWETIMTYKTPIADDAKMNRYNVHFIASDNEIYPYFTSYGVERFSCLFSSDPICATGGRFLIENRYVAFANSHITLWFAKGGSPYG